MEKRTMMLMMMVTMTKPQVNKEFDKSFERFFFGIYEVLQVTEAFGLETVSKQSHLLYNTNERTHIMCCDSMRNGWFDFVNESIHTI